MTPSECPSCTTPLPVDPRYVTWCHECEWNLSPPAAPSARADRRLDRLVGRAGKRLGKSLLEELLRADQLRPGLTAAKAAAYAIALAVHAFVLAIAAAGIWLIAGVGGLFPIIAGVLLLGLAFLMRPRLGKRPKDVLARESFPALYHLVDEIADSLGTGRVDAITINAEYNASWSVVGIRRERVLTIGLPLMQILEPKEQVALLAHELAHARNGDSMRGLVVGSAIGSLGELYATLVPDSPGLGSSELDVMELAARPFAWVLAQPIRILLVLELQLLLRDSQRAEYLADALAARTAGTAAVIGLHEKLLLEHTLELTLQQAALAPASARGDALQNVKAALAAVPERERERRRRLARLEAASLGATHPPTGQRIELLEKRPPMLAAVRVDDERHGAIDDELAPTRVQISRRLVDEYRAGLHS